MLSVKTLESLLHFQWSVSAENTSVLNQNRTKYVRQLFIYLKVPVSFDSTSPIETIIIFLNGKHTNKYLYFNLLL